jgi:hypothetical protein
VPTLIDSGGPALVLPTAAHQPLAQAIASSPAFQQLFGSASWFGNLNSTTPAPASPDEIDAMLPPLTVEIDGTPPIALQLPASTSYLVWQYDGAGGYAYAPGMVADSGMVGFADFGNTLMRSQVVVIDRANRKVGFAPATPCP